MVFFPDHTNNNTQGGSDRRWQFVCCLGKFLWVCKIEQKKELNPLAIQVGRPALIGKYPGNKTKIERELFLVIGSFKTTKMMIIPAWIEIFYIFILGGVCVM